MSDKIPPAAVEAEKYMREVIAEVADQEILQMYEYESPEIPASVMTAYRATDV